ncbi:MAG: hypothetical protein R6U28_06335 [Cyclonatronaceae bacterium]
MGKKIVLYTLLATGIVVILVGFQNLYQFWGEASISGIMGQLTGGICILGGFVNLWVARKFRSQSGLAKDAMKETDKGY